MLYIFADGAILSMSVRSMLKRPASSLLGMLLAMFDLRLFSVFGEDVLR